MKKIIALLLAAVCVFGLCTVGICAGEGDEANHALFEDRFESIYSFILDTGFDGFDETTLTSSMVISYLEGQCRKEFTEYVREDEEYIEGIHEVYYVPETVFESVAAKYFVLADDIIARMHNHPDHVTEGENNYYVFQFYGGKGGLDTVLNYYGYVPLEDNTFMVYAHIVQLFPLESTEGLTEGVDYILDVLDYDKEAGLVPLAIKGYRTMKVKFDGDNLLTLAYAKSSYEVFAAADVVKEPVEAESEDVVYDVPEEVVIDGDASFEGGTTVTCENVVSGDVYDRVSLAMEETVTKYLVFELTAEKDNVSVQPNGKVYVTFGVPGDYDGEIVVYYVDTDGNKSEVPSVYNQAEQTVTAELTHFSTYVVANVVEADAGEDVTPDGGEDVTPDEGGADSDESPKTGDHSQPALYLVVMMGSIFGLAALLTGKRYF